MVGRNIVFLTLLLFVGFVVGRAQMHHDLGHNCSSLSFESPNYGDIFIDNDGIFMLDSIRHNLRIIDVNLTMQLIAGSGVVGGYDGDNKLAKDAQFKFPTSLERNGNGDFLIADSGNHRLRRIDRNGIIHTFGGTGAQGFDKDKEGYLATDVRMNKPISVFYHHPTGETYFSDSANNLIRKIDVNGRIWTVAGNGERGYNMDGINATNAMLNSPRSVVVDSEGEIYISDTNNNRIRKVSKNGIISTIVGTGIFGNEHEELATSTSLAYPRKILVTSNKEVFITDTNNHMIRKLDMFGKITTIAGNGKDGYERDGVLATRTSLNYPNSIFLDGDELYISEIDRLRKVDSNGIIWTVTAAYDPDYTCLCETGFTCSYLNTTHCFGALFNAENVCNGNGLCIENDHCECYNGWSGSNCEIPSCFNISAADVRVCSGKGKCEQIDMCTCLKEGVTTHQYYGENCQYLNCTLECGTNGKCVINGSSDMICECNEGYSTNFNSSFFCRDCEEGFIKDSYGKCVKICPQGYWGDECNLPKCFDKFIVNEVCSGHGNCTSLNKCNCQNGFSGDDCSIITCNGKSEWEGGCSFHGSCSQHHICICEGNFIGPDCSICKDGFKGHNCDIPICNGLTMVDSSVCSGKGVCSSENGIPQCKCYSGYEGKNCQSFKCGNFDRLDENVCSSRGKCTGLNVCNCVGNFDPKSLCSNCLPSFNGSLCEEKICLDSSTCSNRGYCDSKLNCNCKPNFSGSFCEKCSEGFVGNECQYSCLPKKTCFGRGTCSDDGKCICNQNAEGENCEKCREGWYGDMCDFNMEVSSFGFNANGDAIIATVHNTKKQIFNCELLIEDISSLGNRPVCLLNGKNQLVINLGTFATIRIGEIISIRKHFSSSFIVNVTIHAGDFTPQPPVAYLKKDSEILSNICGFIYLDASSSASFDRRPLIFSWKIIDSPSVASTMTLNSYLEFQTGSNVKVDGTSLSIGVYTIQLIVKSSFSDKQSTIVSSFRTIDTVFPQVSIRNGDYIHFSIGSYLSIFPTVNLPNCYNSSTNLLNYEYSLLEGEPLELNQKGANLIFGNDFTKILKEGIYKFKLTVSENGFSAGFSEFVVMASLSNEKVSFSIGDMIQSYQDNVTFHLSNSNEFKEVILTCTNLETYSDCEEFSKNQKQDSFSQKMNVGVYLFTATIGKSTSTITVRVVDRESSFVKRVYIKTLSTIDLSIIDPSKDLLLYGQNLDPLSYQCSFLWTSSDLNFDDSNVILNNRYLVIPKSLLIPGESFKVTLTIIDGESVGEASTTFQVNTPPTIGSLEIFPKTGKAVMDFFKISCENGWSDINQPILFKFLYRNLEINQWHVLEDYSQKRSLITRLPAGQLEIQVIVSDSLGSTTKTSLFTNISMNNDDSFINTIQHTLLTNTWTVSTVSSVLSVIQIGDNQYISEIANSIISTIFNSIYKQYSISSLVSIISATTNFLTKLSFDNVELVINQFTNLANITEILSIDDIFTSIKTAESLENHVVLGETNQNYRSTFSITDTLEKIENAKIGYFNLLLENSLSDMPPIIYRGIRSHYYLRKVSNLLLKDHFEKVVDDTKIVSFNLSSNLAQYVDPTLDEFKIYVRVLNSSTNSLSNIFTFKILNATPNLKIKNSSLVFFEIPKIYNRNQESVVCKILKGGIFVSSKECIIVSEDPETIILSLSTTGTFVLERDETVSDDSTVLNFEKTNLYYLYFLFTVVPILLVIIIAIMVKITYEWRVRNYKAKDIQLKV